MNLNDFVKRLEPKHTYTWAYDNYKTAILLAARYFGARSLLEIGGGRSPLFTGDEVNDLGLTYTVNDISADELERAPAYVSKQCFDIAGKVPTQATYNLIFSKMVFEHVANAGDAYRNLHKLLSPGGVVLNFHPTLYSIPFILNKLLPESIALMLMEYIHPAIGAKTARKFPAYYSYCYATEKSTQMLKSVGFEEILIIPFYGTNYFAKFPMLSSLDNWFNEVMKRHDYRLFASYAFTLARKSEPICWEA